MLGGRRSRPKRLSPRFEVLREAVGALVAELQRQMAEARAAVDASDRSLGVARDIADQVQRGARGRA